MTLGKKTKPKNPNPGPPIEHCLIVTNFWLEPYCFGFPFPQTRWITRAGWQKEKASFSLSCQSPHDFPVRQKSIRRWWEISETHWSLQGLKEYWDLFQHGDKSAPISNTMRLLFHCISFCRERTSQMFRVSGMALILVSKLFIFLTNLIPLVLFLFKTLCSSKNKTKPNPSTCWAYRKRHTLQGINPTMFSVPRQTCVFCLFAPHLGAGTPRGIHKGFQHKFHGEPKVQGRAPSSLPPLYEGPVMLLGQS